MASDIYYSGNPADWNALEGVYIDEVPAAAVVEGVDMQTVGMATKTVRGPTNRAVLCDTPERFNAVFGGRDITPGGALYSEGYKALLGKQFAPLYVRRVAASAAVAATVTADTKLKIDASSVGIWGNQVNYAIVDPTDGNANHFNLQLTLGNLLVSYENLDISGTNDNTLAVVGDDDGNIVVLTKLSAGRPVNGSGALAGGDDGTVATTDYLTGLTDIANTEGVSVCFVPEATPTPATLNTGIVTLAAEANERTFFVWSGVFTNTPAQEVTAKTAQITTPSPRIYWFYNGAKVLDPASGTKVDVAPHTFAASIMSRNAVDVHIGAVATLSQTASVLGLENEALKRGDLVTLRKNGICSFEHQKRGFRFRSGIATDGFTRLVDRRQRDYLQQSGGEFLAPFVDGTNSAEARAQMSGGLASFSDNLKTSGRIVEDYRVKVIGTAEDRAQNREIILWEVRLIGHTEVIVLRTDIATGTIVDVGTSPAASMSAARSRL